MACEGCDGFTDVIFAVVTTFWPPMYIGYSLPNSAATFFSAASMAERFSGLEKSMNGSLVNSETWIFVSAVAMASLLVASQTTYSTSPLTDATRLGRSVFGGAGLHSL